MTQLDIGHVGKKHFRLPTHVGTETIAILGIRGSGKTNTAGVIAEGLLDVEQQVIVLDPTDVWWGLKASADGKAAGYPIVILGGSHGDLPLAAGDGETIADFVTEHRASVILSLRHLRKGEQKTFVTAFAERLFHRKGEADKRTPAMVIIDECHLFVPQKVGASDARLVGAIEDLVRLGRNAGIGVALISQRAASVNKDVLTQLEVLVAHRHHSPQDRKALEAWIEAHDAENRLDEFMASLATLKLGEAWFWAPGLELFERVQVRPRKTYDSSKTPTAGRAAPAPKKLADVDLVTLKANLGATIEKAKADDPRELRKQIADLQRQVKAKVPALPGGKAPLPGVDPKSIERAVAAAIRDRDAEWLGVLDGYTKRLRETVQELTKARPDKPAAFVAPKASTVSPNAPIVAQKPAFVPRPRPHATSGGGGNGDSTELAQLPGPHRKILASLAWWAALDVHEPTVHQCAAIAGYAASGSFDTYLARMGTAGLIVRERGFVRFTDDGAKLAPVVDAPGSLDELHRRLLDTLDGPMSRITSALIERGGEALSVEDLATASNYAPSGSFDTYLSRMGSRGLIERKRGMVTPTNLLFPESL